MISIKLNGDEKSCETIGFINELGYEFRATVANIDLLSDCEAFIRYIGDYVETGATILSGETISYGYWLVKASLDNDKRMSFMEYNSDATEFIVGIDNAVRYRKEQQCICDKVASEFDPIRPDKLIVISDGVYEGDVVEGVRYPVTEAMSGWWISTDRYNGDIKSLKTVHAYHVTGKRPDLTQFLALTVGHRFRSQPLDVWFDDAATKKGKR